MSEPTSPSTIAVDMGGTHIRAAVFGPSGHLGPTLRRPLPAVAQDRVTAPARLVVELVRSLGTDHPSRLALAGVGVAVAGTVRDNHLTWSANLGLSDADLCTPVTEATGAPCWLINDARAAGLAEATRLDLDGLVLALTVGTGIGGAIVHRRQVVEGNGDAGEIGHLLVQPDGPACGCGARGCWETVAAGQAIRRQGLRLGLGPDDPAGDLVRAAETDPVGPGAKAVDALVRDFSAGLSAACAVLGPQAIVLGGGVMARDNIIATRYLLAARQARWAGRSEVVLSGLGDAAGLIGASLYARSGLVP